MRENLDGLVINRRSVRPKLTEFILHCSSGGLIILMSRDSGPTAAFRILLEVEVV